MFEGMGNMFNGMFGKIEPGLCRLSVNGDIAIKTAGGYKAYNLKKGTLTNVTNFCFDVGQEFFFVIPTNKARVGDILLIGGDPKCVIGVDGKKIEVIDYKTSEIRTVLPERHIFMGQTYFYGKIVSMFGGGNFLKNSKKGPQKIMKMLMMQEMMKGGPSSTGNGMGGLGNIAMMSMLFGGGNGFGDMFDGMFDFDMDEEDSIFDEVDDSDDDEKDGE